METIEPKVGMGATMGVGSDCYALTVTEVSGKRIVAQMNKCICKDYYAGEWEVTPELEGGVYAFTLRKDGTWVTEGAPLRSGQRLWLGHQRRYEDPSY